MIELWIFFIVYCVAWCVFGFCVFNALTKDDNESELK